MENKGSKKLLAASAAYIMGMSPRVKIKGTESKLEAYNKVLNSSKELYENLIKGDESLISDSLNKKKHYSKKFKKEFGWAWPF
tara:strand:+ start:199 stop:447 length:249 start_codon:yes stop_codon:yes gene_type:complete